MTDIAGYEYDSAQLAASPVSAADVDLLDATLL